MLLSIRVHLSFRLFAHVKMQALVQAQRFIVFSIFDSLMARQRDGRFFSIVLVKPN